MESSAPDPIGTVLAGRYRVERLLGTGGMGAVYEARQQDLGRRVAVKVLHPHLAHDASLVARFRREAEAAAGLGHPNIVQVTDFGRSDDGSVFLVMDYLDGASLATVIEREGRLEPRRAARVGCQVLSALEAAHGAGLIHRDLKPDNVFLTHVAGVGEVVKLLDFGIAKLVEGEGSGLTATGAVLGTPAYMAPEQARGAEIDARVDLYAVGVLLYESLTGRLPYGGSNYNAMIAAILTEDPPPVSSLRPDLPGELATLVDRAMARDPAARFRSAAEMRAALEPFAELEASSALPSSPPAGGTGFGTDPTVASTPATSTPATQPAAAREASTVPARVRPALWVPALLLIAAVVGGGVVYALVQMNGAGPETAGAGQGPATDLGEPPVATEAVVEDDAPAVAAADAGGDDGEASEAEETAEAESAEAGDDEAPGAERTGSRRAGTRAARLRRIAKRRAARRPRYRVVYSGGMTHNRYSVQELREAVGRIAPLMTRCYRGRDEIGNYDWAVDIDAQGRATNPRPPGHIHDPEPVLACMRQAASQLDFGRPPDGGPGELRFWVRRQRVED